MTPSRRRLSRLAAVAAAALALAACGGGSDTTTATKAEPITVVQSDGSTRIAPAQTGTTTVRPPTPAAPRTAAERLAVVIRQRLVAGGIDASVDETSGGAGGVTAGDASITVYESEAESRNFYRSLRRTIRTVRGMALGRRVGTRNYYYAGDGKPDARDRATFDRIVRVAEGR